MSLSQLEKIKKVCPDLYKEIISEPNLGFSLLRRYKGLSFTKINEKLRLKSNNFEFIEALMNKSLEKEFHRPNCSVTFRNDCYTFSPKGLKWFQEHINQIICFPAFLSTYSNFERGPNDKVNYMEIHLLEKNSNAFNISNIKAYDPEEEVLFKSKTCFKIISVIDGRIILHETTESPNITLYQDVGCYNPKFREGFQEGYKINSLADEDDI
jgi:hypothetical protein